MDDRIKKLFNNIDTDPSMDQRITEQLMNYPTARDSRLNAAWYYIKNSFISRNSALYSITRIAAIIILITFLGTTTVLATNHLIMTYKADMAIVPEEDFDSPPEYTVKEHYGTGHPNSTTITKDAEGNIIETKPEDPNGEDKKYGDEVFKRIGLPNLIPSYLYEHYLLGEGGYLYIESPNDDGSPYREISAFFYAVNSGRKVYVYFSPSDASTKDRTMTYMTDRLAKDYVTSIYTTSGGLLCNIVQDKIDGLIGATIYFDSEKLGNGAYFISFDSVSMAEVEDILNSLPIMAAEE